jgi:hypothetical protein
MELFDIKQNTIDLLKVVSEKIEQNEIDNDGIVQLIELAGDYLNLKTISYYAKINNLSYNGVKKNRKIIKIFNVKFVIDNY